MANSILGCGDRSSPDSHTDLTPARGVYAGLTLHGNLLFVSLHPREDRYTAYYVNGKHKVDSDTRFTPKSQTGAQQGGQTCDPDSEEAEAGGLPQVK